MSKEREQDLFNIKVVIGFFILILLQTVLLAYAFYKGYGSNAFQGVLYFIGFPIINGIFFVWVLSILWAYFKEKHQNEDTEES